MFIEKIAFKMVQFYNFLITFKITIFYNHVFVFLKAS